MIPDVSSLADFKLEVFFSQWEFRARHHLTASDAQTLTVSELLELADDEQLAAWGSLALGYRETYGSPAVRQAIADTYELAEPADVLCFAGAQEAIACAVRALIEPGEHAVVVTPNYQAVESLASKAEKPSFTGGSSVPPIRPRTLVLVIEQASIPAR